MGKRVLIVDDDPMIRGLVSSVLAAEGYEVTQCEDGLKAIELLDKEPRPIDFAFIVLDVVMPGMNGLDVLTRLKLHSHTSTIPVMMLTGEDKAEDLMAGYSVGADLYVTKPFTRAQLVKGVNIVQGLEEA
jgi:DNA-binding response OmpR family regulator